MYIYKYELEPGAARVISMPEGATILSVQSQLGNLVFWALVDPTAPPEERRFAAYMTGYEIPDEPGKYIGTAQFSDGVFVVHVFEVTNG